MKSILITGGSGFFGRHFIKRLLSENEYGRICVYSRDEAKQAQMRLDISDTDERLRYFIGDVRDKDRLYEACAKIDVLVHAASLKRVETCHYSPTEAIKTNITGTINVIEVSNQRKIKKVVLISSDKAANAQNLYGASKYLMERLFISANDMHGQDGPKYSCVRYGNVWRSTMSVVPAWEEILKTSCEVPVTDPDCTRFFMTIQEACQLVYDTIQNMRGGEVNIPTLPAYRLGDLAEAMGAAMKIIGLPKIEKKHETMDGVHTSETVRRMSVDEIREALKYV